MATSGVAPKPTPPIPSSASISGSRANVVVVVSATVVVVVSAPVVVVSTAVVVVSAAVVVVSTAVVVISAEVVVVVAAASPPSSFRNNTNSNTISRTTMSPPIPSAMLRNSWLSIVQTLGVVFGAARLGRCRASPASTLRRETRQATRFSPLADAGVSQVHPLDRRIRLPLPSVG